MTNEEARRAELGKGVITRDSKVGQIVNGVVTVAGLLLVEWLGDLDFSTAPRIIATLAPPAVGLVVGWITTKALPRFGSR